MQHFCDPSPRKSACSIVLDVAFPGRSCVDLRLLPCPTRCLKRLARSSIVDVPSTGGPLLGMIRLLARTITKLTCSNSADVRWMNTLQTATLGCGLRAYHRHCSTRCEVLRKQFKMSFIVSARKETGQCKWERRSEQVGQRSTAQ